MKKQKQEQYRGFRTAGIRLTEELLPNIVDHSSQHELPQLYAYHMFDKAHLVMLAEEKILKEKDVALMLTELREIEKQGLEKVRLQTGGGMHSGEQYLIRKLSEEVGGNIHLGRSSGDMDKTSDRIFQRDKLLDTMDAINEFREALLDTAARYVDVVMPAYTHLQHAQPTTFGHQMLAWAATMSRDYKRLESALSRINVSPAGAGIMTGSIFPLNRHRTAELLGFDRPTENTFDAIHSPDDIIEVFSVVTILHANLARFADDMMMWTSSEIGVIDIPDRFCATSSILAQKKNVVSMEHVRGAAANTVGGLQTAFFAEKGTTGLSIMGRNRYARPALIQAFEYVVRDLKWFTELIPALKLNKKLMLERAGAYWAQASDVAAALVTNKKLSWRSAHQIVGILVRLSLERGIKPLDVNTELLDEAAVEYLGKPLGLSAKILQKALDPVEFVNARTLYGGPAPEESKRRVRELSAILKKDELSVASFRSKLKKAAVQLEEAIDSIVYVNDIHKK